MRELVVDVLLGDLDDRPLDLEPLVVRQVELRTHFDVHLEIHRPLVGELDRLDVEPRLGDRIELVVLVDLLERRHQERRLDLVGDLLSESLDDQLPGSTPRPEAGTTASFRSVSSDSSYWRSISARGIVILRCFLHGPASVMATSISSLRFGARLTGSARRLVAHRNRRLGFSSSVLINGFPSSDIRPGWLDPPSRNPARSSESRQPRMASIKSGRRDLNPRHPRWQRGALPLSYSRMSQRNQEMRPTHSNAASAVRVRNQNQYSAVNRDCKPSPENADAGPESISAFHLRTGAARR